MVDNKLITVLKTKKVIIPLIIKMGIFFIFCQISFFGGSCFYVAFSIISFVSFSYFLLNGLFGKWWKRSVENYKILFDMLKTLYAERKFCFFCFQLTSVV